MPLDIAALHIGLLCIWSSIYIYMGTLYVELVYIGALHIEPIYIELLYIVPYIAPLYIYKGATYRAPIYRVLYIGALYLKPPYMESDI